MKYERRFKNRGFEAFIEELYGSDTVELIRTSNSLPLILIRVEERCAKLGEDNFEKAPVFDPDGWNPYPEVIPPINSGNDNDTSHWLVQNKAGQMRSMTFYQEYGPERCVKEWKHPEFGVIAFRKLPETFKKE